MSEPMRTKKQPIFRNRGESMDRLETFVAAAFAFAVTMLVISVDDVPSNYAQFVYAVKLIPSFAASFAVIVWIWASHANWCRRYGLEDGPAIIMSATLVFLVLVYIYPLRAMMQVFFAAASNGYLPYEMAYEEFEHIRFMFMFYAAGFFFLALNFVGLYAYAYAKRDVCELTKTETFLTQSDVQSWWLASLIALLSFILALTLPNHLIGWSGYSYFLLFVVLTGHGYWRQRVWMKRDAPSAL